MAIVRWILAKLCKKVWFKGLLLMDLICTQGCSVINSEGGTPCGFLILSRGVIWQNMNSGDTEYDKMWAPGMIILAENRINQDENLSPVRRCAILVLMDSNCMNLRNIRYVIDVLHWIWMEPHTRGDYRGDSICWFWGSRIKIRFLMSLCMDYTLL